MPSFRAPLDNLDLFFRQTIQFVHKLVDLLIHRGDLALYGFFFAVEGRLLGRLRAGVVLVLEALQEK